ncbi:glucosamine-6-phosphate deaminase [Paenibacillus sp. HWE-109]|uniref:glucosamine-6-phosphate deaminase n=1 Tax=Paenibacillus sp. HWE-109 TaxID=1306526 RepID=UPI001EE0DDAF|nr:glucosamine-6-phosphate deaminase [Paenibacillus sp. HWE-109]UKS24517.1 glucosamine-6-phosphate deaminase [Paenibacillus sp. HWE-109]
MMRIAVFGDPQQADRIGAEVLERVVLDKAHPKLGLATGSSPVGIYQELVERLKLRPVSFKHASTYNLDEYVGLSVDHPQSYSAYMREHLFQHLDMLPSHCHIPNGMAPSLEAEIIRYERLLREAGALDVQLLGIGLNGHIGFNEPGQHLSSETHIVALTEDTRSANAKYFSAEEPIPSHAITMGVGPIMKAECVLFIAHGESKSSIIQAAFTGPVTTSCPASFLQLHSNVIVLLDEEAADGLLNGGKPRYRMIGNKRIEFLYDPKIEEIIGEKGL